MIQINQHDLDDISATFKELEDIDKHKSFKKFAQNVYEDTIHNADAHTKTGALIRSIFKTKVSDGYIIGADKSIAPYAVFVHWGTKPHKIERKKRKALRWTSNAGFIFAKSVNHPGYDGDPFLLNALNDNIKKLPALFDTITKDL